MFKRCSILAVVSLFILTMIYTVTTAQEKKEKFVFVKGIKGLESGDGVITECRGSKGEYEAVKVKRITKSKK